MKTLGKWCLGFVMGIAYATVAAAGEPIKDKDAFEKQYVECIISGFKDRCWSKLLLKHARPHEGNDQDIGNVLRKIEAIFGDQGSIYKVHSIEKAIVADMSDSRTYMVEFSNGKFCGVFLRFIKIKEEWYITDVSVNNDESFLKKILKSPM
jgi:hypothetical protein